MGPYIKHFWRHKIEKKNPNVKVNCTVYYFCVTNKTENGQPDVFIYNLVWLYYISPLRSTSIILLTFKIPFRCWSKGIPRINCSVFKNTSWFLGSFTLISELGSFLVNSSPLSRRSCYETQAHKYCCTRKQYTNQEPVIQR